MKKMSVVFTFLFAMLLMSSVTTTAQEKTSDGKKIFEANKCNMCHSIKAEKIEATSKSKAPDLSAVGSDQKPEWIQKFLKKDEQLNGKKHPFMFKGTDAELKTLATWLAGHKKS
ncbi:MAG: c-type cytochrome [Methanococcaceae archaeon]